MKLCDSHSFSELRWNSVKLHKMRFCPAEVFESIKGDVWIDQRWMVLMSWDILRCWWHKLVEIDTDWHRLTQHNRTITEPVRLQYCSRLLWAPHAVRSCSRASSTSARSCACDISRPSESSRVCKWLFEGEQQWFLRFLMPFALQNLKSGHLEVHKNWSTIIT